MWIFPEPFSSAAAYAPASSCASPRQAAPGAVWPRAFCIAFLFGCGATDGALDARVVDAHAVDAFASDAAPDVAAMDGATMPDAASEDAFTPDSSASMDGGLLVDAMPNDAGTAPDTSTPCPVDFEAGCDGSVLRKCLWTGNLLERDCADDPVNNQCWVDAAGAPWCIAGIGCEHDRCLSVGDAVYAQSCERTVDFPGTDGFVTRYDTCGAGLSCFPRDADDFPVGGMCIESCPTDGRFCVSEEELVVCSGGELRRHHCAGRGQVCVDERDEGLSAYCVDPDAMRCDAATFIPYCEDNAVIRCGWNNRVEQWPCEGSLCIEDATDGSARCEGP